MIKSIFLICRQSPKKAFYNLVLAEDKILKVSGNTFPEKQILDKRILKFESPDVAKKFFDSKIREKSHKKRKRVYQAISA